MAAVGVADDDSDCGFEYAKLDNLSIISEA